MELLASVNVFWSPGAGVQVMQISPELTSFIAKKYN